MAVGHMASEGTSNSRLTDTTVNKLATLPTRKKKDIEPIAVKIMAIHRERATKVAQAVAAAALDPVPKIPTYM